MKFLKTFGCFILLFIPIHSFSQAEYGDTVWAKSTVSGNSVSEFKAVTADSSGNYFAAGFIQGIAPFGFGNGVTINVPNTGDIMLVVKYDSSGNAIWAKSIVSSTDGSRLSDVATDSNGNIYVAGYIANDGTFDLGNGVTVSGSASGLCRNIFIAKYDQNGDALWAKSTTAGTNTSRLYAIAVDSSNNVYVAGEIETTGTYDFGNGVTAAGSSSGDNLVLIKYDTNGVTQWAKTVSGSSDISYTYGIALDSSGNLYTAGMIDKGQTFNLGNDVTVAGAYAGYNIFLAKYSSGGDAQWATTAVSASGYSVFKGLALDKYGNILAGGYVEGPKDYGFGNGVNVTVPYNGTNALLLKYNSAGLAQWAEFPTTANGNSEFDSTIVDAMGNIFAAGYAQGTGQFDFGNNVTTSGVDASKNLVLVNYDSAGNALLVKDVVNGTQSSAFLGVGISESSGDICTGGWLGVNRNFDLGNNVTVSGSGSFGVNAVIVKYKGISPSSSSSRALNNSSSSSSSSNNSPVASKAVSLKLKVLPVLGAAILLLP